MQKTYAIIQMENIESVDHQDIIHLMTDHGAILEEDKIIFFMANDRKRLAISQTLAALNNSSWTLVDLTDEPIKFLQKQERGDGHL